MSGVAVGVARAAGSPLRRHHEDGPLALDTALALLPARHLNARYGHYLVLVLRRSAHAFSSARLGKGGA